MQRGQGARKKGAAAHSLRGFPMALLSFKFLLTALAGIKAENRVDVVSFRFIGSLSEQLFNFQTVPGFPHSLHSRFKQRVLCGKNGAAVIIGQY